MRGRPRHWRIGGTASTTASSIRLSCTLAPVSVRARGMPVASMSDVALRARLAAIGRVRAGRRAPFLPATVALSSEARLTVDPVRPAEPVQQHAMQAVPHSGPLPVAQAPPAGHARATAHLPRQHLPRRCRSAARTGSPSAPPGRMFAADRPSAWRVQAAAAVRSRPRGHREGAVSPSPSTRQTRFC